MAAGLRAMGFPATVGFVVKQTQAGASRYFAGRDRWSPAIEEATLYRLRREATAVAVEVGGFVVRRVQ